MSMVGIVTDSTNCLPPDLIKQYDIKVGSLSLVINREIYRDQVDICSAEFYRLYRGLKDMPTTIAISPGEFVEIFREMSKTTHDIACILLSGALSATYGSAVQAKQLVQEENPALNIELIDSKTAAGALGFIALEMAKVAQSGHGMDEVVLTAHDLMPRVKIFAMLDTLKYLIKGGRAPRIAMIGELMKVKPIVGLVNNTGKVDPLRKPRTKQKALSTMVDMVKDYVDTSRPLHVNIHYAESLEEGKKLQEMVTSTYNCSEVMLTELTPVMCCHTGPMMGLSFYS